MSRERPRVQTSPAHVTGSPLTSGYLVVLGALGPLIVSRPHQKMINFGDREAGQLDVDLLALCQKVFEFARKQVLVPTGVLVSLLSARM